MKLFYSGRVLLYAKPKRNIKQRPEDLLKSHGIMLSYNYLQNKKSQDYKRFKKYKQRKVSHES